MLSFTPSLNLENEMKHLQGQLAELYQTLDELPPAEAQYLHRFAFISNIGASTRIENAVLTDNEIDWVDTALSRDDHPSAFENQKTVHPGQTVKRPGAQHRRGRRLPPDASDGLLQAEELYPLHEAAVRGLHHDLLQFYPQAAYHAGSYKQSPNRVLFVNNATGEERIVLDPAPPGIMTETAMADLVGWYNPSIRRYPWPLLVATELVFRFLAIHPFQDGNGRLGRALFILTLLQSGDKYWTKIVPFLAVDRHIEQNRSLYYTSLQRAAGGRYQQDPRQYDYVPVAWFFLKIIREALPDIGLYRQRYARHEQLSETALTVLKTFKDRPEKRLKVSEIEKRHRAAPPNRPICPQVPGERRFHSTSRTRRRHPLPADFLNTARGPSPITYHEASHP